MKTLPHASTQPGLRFVMYTGHEALHITDELQHLELVSARVPFEHEPPQPVPDTSWLDSCTAEPGFQLVTMSTDGLLIGFAAGVFQGGMVDLRHLVLASSVRTRHPELAGELTDVFVDAADAPWADLRISHRSPALRHLLDDGWRPTTTGDATASNDTDEQLVLSAAGSR